VIGMNVAFAAVPLREQGWQLAAFVSATCIGSPINCVATAPAVGLSATAHGSELVSADLAPMVSSWRSASRGCSPSRAGSSPSTSSRATPT